VRSARAFTGGWRLPFVSAGRADPRGLSQPADTPRCGASINGVRPGKDDTHFFSWPAHEIETDQFAALNIQRLVEKPLFEPRRSVMFALPQPLHR